MRVGCPENVLLVAPPPLALWAAALAAASVQGSPGQAAESRPLRRGTDPTEIATPTPDVSVYQQLIQASI